MSLLFVGCSLIFVLRVLFVVACLFGVHGFVLLLVVCCPLVVCRRALCVVVICLCLMFESYCLL